MGDSLRAVDGLGRARAARVAAVDRAAALLELGGEAPSREPALTVELLVATPRPQRADWLVEKATEVGCTALRFLATERSPRHLGPTQIDRLRRVGQAAVEQCGRARLPEVTGSHPWSQLPRLLSALPDRFVLDPEPAPAAPWQAPAGPVALLVGPEGGWTEAERRDLERLGCRSLSLGPRILRLETAAIVAAGGLLCFAPPAPGWGAR